MAAPLAGPITFSSTGDITVPLPYVPSYIEFSTGGKAGINEVTNARSGEGYASPSYQYAMGELTNASGYFTRTYPGTDAFVILDGPTGAPIVKGKVKTWATNCVFTLTDASSQFQVYMKVYP